MVIIAQFWASPLNKTQIKLGLTPHQAEVGASPLAPPQSTNQGLAPQQSTSQGLNSQVGATKQLKGNFRHKYNIRKAWSNVVIGMSNEEALSKTHAPGQLLSDNLEYNNRLGDIVTKPMFGGLRSRKRLSISVTHRIQRLSFDLTQRSEKFSISNSSKLRWSAKAPARCVCLHQALVRNCIMVI